MREVCIGNGTSFSRARRASSTGIKLAMSAGNGESGAAKVSELRYSRCCIKSWYQARSRSNRPPASRKYGMLRTDKYGRLMIVKSSGPPAPPTMKTPDQRQRSSRSFPARMWTIAIMRANFNRVGQALSAANRPVRYGRIMNGLGSRQSLDYRRAAEA